VGKVCDVNKAEFEKMYETKLVVEGIKHTDVGVSQYYEQYGIRICPVNGDINYFDRNVEYNGHGYGHDVEPVSDEEGVPSL
jgi:hypothetical protein